MATAMSNPRSRRVIAADVIGSVVLSYAGNGGLDTPRRLGHLRPQALTTATRSGRRSTPVLSRPAAIEQFHQYRRRATVTVDDTPSSVMTVPVILAETLTSIVMARAVLRSRPTAGSRSALARTRVTDVGAGRSGGTPADLRCEKSIRSCESL